VVSNPHSLEGCEEGVLRLSRLASVVDELWLLTRDGRWHTKRDLARKSSFKPEAVNAALGFLVKYGFAHSSGGAEMMIRVTGGPSPNEVASVLSVLTSANLPRAIYS
jgi:hypothetical protein